MFSQYLLNSGIDEERIECIIDNDPVKQGKRLYGTNLKVYGSSKLTGYDNAVVILHDAHEDHLVGIQFYLDGLFLTCHK